MRLIEKEMNAAINEGRDWAKDNTRVVSDAGGTIVDVFLHGNHIAEIQQRRDSHTVFVNRDTLRNWPTRTTLSRLRALGVSVYTHKGEVVLNGEPL